MKILKWSTFAVLLVLAAVLLNALYFKPWFIRVFFERVAIEQALASPQALSTIRILESFGVRGHNAKLDDISEAHESTLIQRNKDNLAILLAYDRDSLSASQQLSYDTMRYGLEHKIAGERFRYHDYPIEQFEGEQFALPNFMANTHQVHDNTDAEHYLRRLRAIETKLDQLRAKQALRAQRGIVAPHFALAKSVVGMREFIAKPAEQNVLYLSFKEKLAGSQDISSGEQMQVLAQAAIAIREHVYPAYQRLINDTDALAQSHPRNDGAWALPDGDAYYAWMLQGHTTTSMTPDQVHQLGVNEVARIEGEMRAILKAQGEPDEDVGAAMKRLGADKRFLYSDDDAGRQQIIKDYKTILREVQAALPKAFGHIPAATLDVRRVPAVSEKTSAAAYYEAAALDGSRPGVFYTSLYDINVTPRWSMRTLAYHEGVPGHHLQTAIAQEQTDLPLFRRFSWYTAYGEGWALYAERLADEMGLEPDPYDKLGRLRDELFRAARLVVDTGMHAKHWSREQAIDYMESHTGMNHGDVVIEIERYLVSPGQACSYKVGMLKLLALREAAKTRLGSRFSLPRFHDLVLRNGALPLDLLARLVNDWIAAGGTN